jgi:hypothetical protein
VKPLSIPERCAFCNCLLQRKSGTYARANLLGRSHATKHHLVAERFFGRSSNRKGTKTDGIFEVCPWKQEGVTQVFCYECHEEMLHNPVFLPEDVQMFRELVQVRCLDEAEKTEERTKLAGRIRLFHDVLAAGLKALHSVEVPISALDDVQSQARQ